MLSGVVLTLALSTVRVLVGDGMNGCVRTGAGELDLVPADELVQKAEQMLAEARKAWQHGRQLALELQNDEAVEELERSLAFYARATAVVEDFSDYARILIDLGALLVDARRFDAASLAFRRAAVLDMGVQPDANRHAPEAVKRFKQEVDRMARTSRGSVSIGGQPAGATVYWDGKRVGVLPVSLGDVLPGDHWLTVLHHERRRFSTQVTIEKKLERVEVFMTELGSDRSPSQRALSVAQHQGAPTADEAAALATLQDNADTIVLLAQNRDAAPDKKVCAMQARVYRRGQGTSALVAITGTLDTARWLAMQPQSPSGRPARLVDQRPPAQRLSPALAWLPFGISQMLEHRPLQAGLLIGSQLALLALNIICFEVGERSRLPDGTFANVKTARGLQITTDVAAGALALDVIGGMIDGIVSR